jgi:hypothetical protein
MSVREIRFLAVTKKCPEFAVYYMWARLYTRAFAPKWMDTLESVSDACGHRAKANNGQFCQRQHDSLVGAQKYAGP